MNAKQIWLLPEDKRLIAFLDRYSELDQFTGNRTYQEKEEMAEISEAVMPALIRFVEQSHLLLNKWRAKATSTPEEMQAFSRGEANTVQMDATYGMCCVQLGRLLERLEGKV